ncbi:hypothetical protein N7495_004173 [Penicillium taxi]|uniref:uncharacterized protein n=1 Tax=Penicillium taxi TaxID=168475 RepID=UPI0025455D57|nr:uncharacterized protein N7495_004173 [Penicillium taxi]KAJ5899429.1 hypothetical protein N7495_004173 [Penicillium taxi]
MKTPMPLVGHSMAMFVVCIVLLALAVTTVALRCFVRLYIVRAFGWDDGLMLFALTMFIGMATCLIGGSMTGLCHHQTDFPNLTLYKNALEWYWVATILYVWSCAFAKLSIAVALLRITVINLHRQILFVVVAIIVSATFLFGFTLLFSCQPASYFWNRIDPGPGETGHCASNQVTVISAYIYTVLSLISDLTLGILPIFLVYQLQMNAKTKFAVGAILSLGSMAAVGCIVRIPYISLYSSPDILYAVFGLTICTVLENASAIIAGSLITLRPLFRWTYERSKLSKKGYKQSPSEYPLSGMDSKKGTHSNTQRPSLEAPKNAVVSVKSPPGHRLFSQDYDSSQEHLNPTNLPGVVRIQETITITDTRK